MKIGIDIDGVLTDISKFYLDYGAKFALEKNIDEIADPDGYEIEDILNLEKGVHKEFWDKYDNYYTKEKYTREFASEIIEKLKNEGNEIYLITARNPEKEEDECWTTNWLKENNIYYDKLTFTDKKLEYCKNNNIDLMIEDSINQITEISKIIPVICLDTRYNKDCKGNNMRRCYSWYDIYTKIKKKCDNINVNTI